MLFFFFIELQLITVIWVDLSKTVCGSFNFRFRLVFFKVYIFVQQKAWTFLLENVIIPFKIKILYTLIEAPKKLTRGRTF